MDPSSTFSSSFLKLTDREGDACSLLMELSRKAEKCDFQDPVNWTRLDLIRLKQTNLTFRIKKSADSESYE